MWILIVYTTLQFGASVNFAEYPNQETCQEAAAWLNGKPAISATCQYRGSDLALN
ncbi:MAG: hypothetical protein VB050_03420 [Geobacteraceae bacterium]|nr:hypothetical protein [Geobacteraceae bacterium]